MRQLQTAGMLIQLAACSANTDPTQTDCTHTPRELAADSGATRLTDDAPSIECSGELPVMVGFDPDTGKARAPDWGCYEQAAKAACPVGPDMPATIQVTYAPGNNVALAGVIVDQFFGPGALGKPAFSGVTDANGEITFQAPAGTERISLWLHGAKDTGMPLTDLEEVYAFGLPIVWPPSKIRASAVISAAVNTVFANVLDSPEYGDKTKAIILAVVRDCSDQDVGGAQLELVDAATNTVVMSGVGAGEPRGVYGRNALPDKLCTFTSSQRSEWMLLNAPTNVIGGAIVHAYKLRAKGRMRATDSEPVVLDEQAIELYPGGFSLGYPYRVWPPKAP